MPRQVDNEALDKLLGRSREVTPPPVIQTIDVQPIIDTLQQMHGTLDLINKSSERMVYAQQQVAKPVNKELEAIVHRDADGRMERITIRITN